MTDISGQSDQLSPLKQAYLALEKARARLDLLERARGEPIAIVGMGCRLPGGVKSPDALWELLASGRDAITEVPANRWDVGAFYDPDPAVPGKIVTRCGGFVDEVERFDAPFFGISPREAMTLDPQQRLLLEVSYEALEDAGMAPDLVASRGAVCLWASAASTTPSGSRVAIRRLIDAYIGTGNGHSVAAGRLSYYFGLQGPSVAIDTACSCSLVAIHLACQSLRVASAISRWPAVSICCWIRELSINFSKAHMLAPDGRCKTFDALADGYSRGEGAGMVVLKRMSDALAAGDRVLAIRGVGRQSGRAEQRADRAARAVAAGRHSPAHRPKPASAPDDVDYVEAHGTGTALGDPIEVDALARCFAVGQRRLRVGSVKTNIGHLEATAGVAGLMKVVLSLRHERIPAHLHFHQPSPRVVWDQLPLRVPTALEPWPRESRPRLAGVSAFAFNGTNAHVVVEEPPVRAVGVETGTTVPSAGAFG